MSIYYPHHRCHSAVLVSAVKALCTSVSNRCSIPPVLREGEGGPGACSPGKFWNLASLKRTFGAISERINWRTEINQNLQWKCTCKRFETPNVKWVTTASLLKLCVLFFIQAKDGYGYHAAVTLLLQTKTQPLEHIGTPMLVCPSQTVCQKRNFRLGAFFYRYMIL